MSFEGQGEEDRLAKEPSKWPVMEEKEQEGVVTWRLREESFFKISHVQCCSGLKDRDIQHRLLDSATRRPLGTLRTISLKCGRQKPDWNGLEREQKERK